MYKYNILHKLKQLSVEDYQISWRFFPEALNVSEATWKRWIYLKKDDPSEIRISQLQLIASFFDCPIEELIEDQEEKKSIKTHFKNFKLML
ncbi:helix-turn-helix domain-containing protein [Brumimicrobium mesophilum]|uniref:helix-turn-helix domain-containing protein n=1 Tax=Brumimicrobium mesophilum TaxID=392717 RepID=UPI000D140293|nr:helix-turn-helix transcriptional regulator [Brumimicrobium mesophilum]